MAASETNFELALGDERKPPPTRKPEENAPDVTPCDFGQLPRLPALSVRQPWATSIMNGKPVENRNWWGRYLEEQLAIVGKPGSRFLLHASRTLDEDDVENWRDLITEREIAVPWAKGLKLGALPLGGIIGVVTFGGWVRRHISPWFTGPGAILISDPTPLPVFPCRGALGFFFPAEIARRQELTERPANCLSSMHPPAP